MTIAANIDQTVSTQSQGEGRSLWTIIAITLTVKLLFAIFLPLGVDENYAIAVASEFSWSFFDHPPVGFWAPVVAAEITGLDYNLIYRLPFLAFGVGTMYAVYHIAAELKDRTAGLWAAFLYAVAPFFVFGGGVMAIPDGPLGCASAFCALYLVKIAKAGHSAPLRLWIYAGIALGFALASKYQSGLIPISALVFAVLTPVGRGWFMRPGLYVGIAIGLVGLAPVAIWNMQNDWISFAFHTSRTDGAFNPASFAFLAVVQAIYLLPTVLIAALAGIKFGLGAWRKPEVLLLVLLALGPILMFNYIYLFSHASFAHWAMPGWLFTIPLAGVWLSGKGEIFRCRFRKISVVLAAVMLAILTLLMMHMKFGVVTRFTHESPPDWDWTIDSFDWANLEDALNERGLLAETEIIVARNWYEGGDMSTALRRAYPIKIAGPGGHHFDYMSGRNAKGTALMLAPESLTRYEKRQQDILSRAQSLDPNAELLAPIILDRGGIPYAAVMLVRLELK